MATTSTPPLDTKSLLETSRQLSKANDGGDPPATLLTLLQPLEKWKATEDSLRQSKIGIIVAKLRSNKDPKVAGLASQLINKWKSDVNKSKKGPPSTGKSGGLAVNGDSGGGGRSGTSSPAPKKEGIGAVPPAPKKFTVDPEKRSVKADGVDTALTGNATRDGSITLIYNGLAFLSTSPPAEILSVSQAVEAAAFGAYAPETSATYKSKMRSLHLNLKMKQNAALRRDIFSGVIEPERFVNMTSEELKSEEMRKKDKELEKENMSKAMTAIEEKAISTTMQCGKCKQYKVAYSQAQTRSADEPMTVFCECQVCGNKWKFS